MDTITIRDIEMFKNPWSKDPRFSFKSIFVSTKACLDGGTRSSPLFWSALEIRASEFTRTEWTATDMILNNPVRV